MIWYECMIRLFPVKTVTINEEKKQETTLVKQKKLRQDALNASYHQKHNWKNIKQLFAREHKKQRPKQTSYTCMWHSTNRKKISSTPRWKVIERYVEK